jgi:hypothetical protein
MLSDVCCELIHKVVHTHRLCGLKGGIHDASEESKESREESTCEEKSSQKNGQEKTLDLN